jgi:hypothetical protein
MKYTRADIERADREMKELSAMAHDVLVKHQEMHLLEAMGLDDMDLVMFTLERGFSPEQTALYCAGFATAMRMIFNASAS